MNTTNATEETGAGTARSSTFLERWEARRERKYLERREHTDRMFPKLRNRTARRRLVIAYLAIIAALLVAGIMLGAAVIGDGFSGWWGVPWIALTVIQVLTWTTLVIVTDNLDGAPIAVLDEYERGRVEGLRSLAYQGFTWFGLLFCLGSVFFGVWVGSNEPEWAADVPYLMGLGFLIPFLILLSVPTAVIAWTMPDE
ncbi:hypothetical protein ACFWGD_12120 [Corynebacterium sp. NPDC060344]|uniref:hypothetical protein n=1 Tax=Corynebacterium sp. NPDC060344 TaxID=3347101 RepID=UPI00365808D7